MTSSPPSGTNLPGPVFATDTNPASQNKRRRGRPLSESYSGGASKRRRSQVRRAQERFRRRKEAAAKSHERRIDLLEDCIKQMSNRFIEFTDSVFKYPAICKDPELLRHLWTATSGIFELAQLANRDSNGEDESGRASNTDLNLSLRESAVLAAPKHRGISADIGNKQIQVLRFEDDDGLQLHSAENGRSPDTPPALTASRPPGRSSSSSVWSNSISYSDNITGNGWFGQNPSAFAGLNVAANSPNGRGDRDSLGFKLIQGTLNTAYRRLLGELDASAPLATQMFRFARLYHSREELLFNLRWFLGPGFSRLPALGYALFGFKDISGALGSNSILNPFVDVSAQAEAGNDTSVPFLNAFGVEDYLKRRGAFHIDRDIVVMQLQDTDNAMAGTGTGPDRYDSQSSPAPPLQNPDIDPRLLPEDNNAHKYSQHEENTNFASSSYGDYGTFSQNVTSAGVLSMRSLPDTPHHQISKVSNSASGFSNAFSFGALLQDSGWQPTETSPESYQSPRIGISNGQIVTISVPLLLQSLIENSVCLGSGPGYPRRFVDHLINSSTTETSLSYERWK